MPANLIPRHWKEILWVTLKETTDTWCTYPTHARLWQFEMLLSRNPKWAQSLTTQRRPTYQNRGSPTETVFTRSRNDHSLFARAETEGHTFILVWVVDIIVASRSITVISDVKKALEATFHVEDRGRLHWFLGLRIRRDEGKVTVDQERYIETMLERFQMDQCKPSRTPADLNLKLQTAQNGDEEVDQKIYRSLVGSLLYLAKQTKPDIIIIVNILSRHMNAPTNKHWMCEKRLLRYLQGSKVLKLTYTKEASFDLAGESDADWSGDANDRKATTGYYFMLN